MLRPRFFTAVKDRDIFLAILLKMPPKKQVTDAKQKHISSFFNKSSKRTSSDSPANDTPAKFSKASSSDNVEVNKQSLSPEQKTRMEEKRQEALNILQEKSLSGIDMGSSWKNALVAEFNKPYFKKLQDFLVTERKKATIYPPEKDVFSWTKFFDIEDTKVVVLGQDPYHGPRQAHGLCFSVQIGVPPPPSLINMYKELEDDIPGFVRPKHGHLVGWSKQGVLLLNACLTVVASQANSHKDKGWEQFTDATIKWINKNLDGVVFILWGMYAQKKGNFVDKSRHLVLADKHPSPLSAHRGFFGCKHFSKTNQYLKDKGKKGIDWSYLPEKL